MSSILAGLTYGGGGVSLSCHSKNGPGKYGPACTAVQFTVEILRALTIKLTQARARTRARAMARAKASAMARDRAMARTTDRPRLRARAMVTSRARARAWECVYV